MVSGQRFRSSLSASCLPATLKGWQGNPALTTSTFPRKGIPSNLDTSLKMGASSSTPSAMRALITDWQYSSHST